MLGVLMLFIFLFLVNQGIFNYFEGKHRFFDRTKMNLLYLYHTFFYLFYLWYIQNNPSDSRGYYNEVSTHRGSWFELFGTDTHFIDFVGYPFYKMGLASFESMMFLFSWFGFIGFVFAYLFFREKIPVKIKVFGIDFLTFLLFLPNMHFWTVSFAKGSLIFMGIMMFTYAAVNYHKRFILLILGSIIVFHIRPHVFMFLAVGVVVGYMTGKEKIPLYQKLGISLGLLAALILLQDKILGVMNLQHSENLLQDLDKFSDKRSGDLSRSSSGVDMQSYPLPFKLFTFWFRPLFVDAPSFVGFFTSLENLLYLLLVFKIIRKDFIKFLRKSPSFVKMSLTIFLATSLAMTFVMSNLGIIMRQKSMVMYFLFFVIYYYLAQKKYKKYMRFKKMKEAKEKRAQKPAVSAA